MSFLCQKDVILMSFSYQKDVRMVSYCHFCVRKMSYCHFRVRKMSFSCQKDVILMSERCHNGVRAISEQLSSSFRASKRPVEMGNGVKGRIDCCSASLFDCLCCLCGAICWLFLWVFLIHYPFVRCYASCSSKLQQQQQPPLDLLYRRLHPYFHATPNPQ